MRTIFRRELWRRWVVIAHDFFWIPVVVLLAYLLRFNLEAIPDKHLGGFRQMLVVATAIHFGTFWLFGCYRGIWRFASIPDLIRLAKAVVLGALLTGIAMFLYTRGTGVPRSVLLLYPLLLMAAVSGPRMAYRALKDHRLQFDRRERPRALIVGAGPEGVSLIRELIARGPYVPAALVDPEPATHGQELHGVRVRGGPEQIPALIEDLDVKVVLIAMPGASRATMNGIVRMAAEARIPCRMLPSTAELAGGHVEIANLRPVMVDDLLGRELVLLGGKALDDSLSGRRVLVTGGGGSIGAELCQQIARHRPAELVILEANEFNLYRIERELERADLPALRAALGDVRDPGTVEQLIKRHRPEVIFHAAAYKHVPMVEQNPVDGVRNNVFGTLNVADAAVRHGVEQFVLISTDKTVDPVNVMGASKRVAELYCQARGREGRTRFITVRFGNVLGSTGSVVPLFEQQIAEGGPVTVTHPDVTRFFMTIAEAVHLILQTAAIGQGGEIYVLDMGEPVRIAELAEKMVRLSGMQPGKDIAIEYAGLRPGEKMHERLFYEHEQVRGTPHPKLLLASADAPTLGDLQPQLERLRAHIDAADPEGVVAALKAIVPQYKPGRTVRATAAEDKALADVRLLRGRREGA